VVTLVDPRLDYGNDALIGLPVYLARRLQSVLNAATRLIFNLRRSDHVSDALISLHWLRVLERIWSKVAVLVYKVLHGCAPSYFGPFTYVADLPSRRGLRNFLQRLPRSASGSPFHCRQPSIFGCWPSCMELPATGGYVGTISDNLPHSTRDVLFTDIRLI